MSSGDMVTAVAIVTTIRAERDEGKQRTRTTEVVIEAIIEVVTVITIANMEGSGGGAEAALMNGNADVPE